MESWSPPNGKLESSHRFIKDCSWKFSVDGVLEWDQLLLYTTASFNLFPNEHSQESPHPYLPHLATFLQPKLRYLGSDKGMICLGKLRQAYMLAALNTRQAQSKQSKQEYDDVPNYKICDLVMIRNYYRKSNWYAKYIPNFTVVCLIGSSQLEVSDPTGRVRKVNVYDAHKIMPSNYIVNSIPDEQVFER